MNFTVEEAMRYGVDEAIVINEFRNRLIKNIKEAKHIIDDRAWLYITYRELKNIFPFWSTGHIRRIIKSLREYRVLKKGNYNKKPYDKTSWYAFESEEFMLGVRQDEQYTVLKIMQTPEGESRKRRKKEASIESNKFKKPTVEEIAEYCKARKNNVDPQRFYDYYEAANWRDGTGRRLRSWKQKMIAVWEKKTTILNRNTDETNVKAPKESAKSVEDCLPEGYTYRQWLEKAVEMKKLPIQMLIEYDEKEAKCGRK